MSLFANDTLTLTPQETLAINTVVGFLRANHNGEKSLQNPRASFSGETFSGLWRIDDAGKQGLKPQMTRDEALNLADACVELRTPGTSGLLESSKIPADITAAAEVGMAALKPLRKGTIIRDMNIIIPEIVAGKPGAEATRPGGKLAGAEPALQQGAAK